MKNIYYAQPLPTPWVGETTHEMPPGGLAESNRYGAYIRSADGSYPALVCYFPDRRMTEEIRDRIVRSVNAHTALVEACKGLLEEIRYLVEDGTLPKAAFTHPSVINARATLALAQGIA